MPMGLARRFSPQAPGIDSVAALPALRRRGFAVAYATAQALRSAATPGFRIDVLQSSQAGTAVHRSLAFREVGPLPMAARAVE